MNSAENLLREIMRRSPPAQPREVNYAAIDRFTLIHFGIGVGYSAIGLGFGVAVLLAIAWEIIENPLKVHLKFLFPHATADTPQNMTGDTCAVLLGWTLHHYLSL